MGTDSKHGRISGHLRKLGKGSHEAVDNLQSSHGKCPQLCEFFYMDGLPYHPHSYHHQHDDDDDDDNANDHDGDDDDSSGAVCC